jgi:hypothetical protein
MDSKDRRIFWIALSTAAASVLLLVVGCALDKDGKVTGTSLGRIGGHSGEILEPKRCLLKVAILSRPFNDPAINEVVWRVADEQIISPEQRRAWEVNGLRLGRMIGELPLELEAIMKDTSPQNKVTPTSFLVECGDPTLVSVSEPVEQASLLLNRENRIFGKDYKDMSGYFRVIAQHQGSNNTLLRLVPEIHHGPIQRMFQAVQSAAPVGPQEFRMNNGQQEETFRELAASLVLEPGQLAVIGCRPDQKRSLGTFFFTQAVAHSDQRIEKLILIWASRNLQGQGPEDRGSTTLDRPKLFKRLKGPATGPSAAKPTAPLPQMPPPGSFPSEAPPNISGAAPNEPPSQPGAKQGAPSSPAATSNGNQGP